MSKELIVSSGRHETRVAILEDDQVVELFHEREKEYSLAGSIHKGRVTRVLPGMQSAFVDIGLERDAFLYVSDFFEDNEEYDAVVSGVEEKILKMEKGDKPGDGAPAYAPVDITEVITSGIAAPPNAEPRQSRGDGRNSENRGDRGGENRGDRGGESRGGENRGDRGGNRNDRTAAPPAAPAAGGESRSPESRSPESRPAGGDAARGAEARGGDNREGRGNRRGRRRRGGRPPSGLPDSKFYSPRGEQDTSPAAETESGFEATEPVTRHAEIPTFSRPSEMLASADDFMVLPGESLAKYSAPESTEPEAEPTPRVHHHSDPAALEEFHGEYEAPLPVHDFAPVTPAPAAEVEEPEQVETAAVDETDPESDFVEVAEIIAVIPIVELRQADPDMDSSERFAEEPPIEEPTVILVESLSVLDSGSIVESVSIVEIDEPEIGDGAEQVEGFEASPELDDESELGFVEGEELETAAELQGESGEDSSEEMGEGGRPAAEDESPEPARIPTSLTATLREQGHRYPHRVSRRMRRKMRGDGPAGEAQPASRQAAAPTDSGEAAPVEVRDDQPADRPASDRSERPERQQRPERQERGERRPEARPNDRPERTGERGGERSSERNGERGAERTGERGAERTGERPAGERTGGRERTERERTPLPSIADLLKEGQEIIVQIAKEPLGQKGARITSHIALPGRFVVYMPTVDHVGVSRKIPSDDERMRLKKVLQTHRQGIPGGFICRTAGDGKTEEELKNDMHFLYNLWLDMRQKAEKKPAPVLLHHDLDLVERVLRDQLTSSFKTIWVDNEEYYESILRFVQRFQPALVSRVKLYTRATPIFDEFGVTNEVEKALRPKVWLKSGGYIVINQTEALVAIDINTGKYVGKSNRLEDTIVKINTDAIKEIVRQIRLRDLGGIIVVDFIDMDERKNRQKVMQSLEEAMRADRAPYKILQFNDFGLVAITRKRVKQSLERTLCAPCPYCEGAGYVKSIGTVISEILQEAQRIQKALDSADVTLRVNPEVAKLLKSNQNTYLQEIEEILGRTVMIKNDPLLHQTKFDLA